jgi:hypothetical protein
MILVITPSVKADEWARALQQGTNEPVQVAGSLQKAGAMLRSQEFTVVVFDQMLMDIEPDDADTILQHLGTAIPVYINFGISGLERIQRELRTTLCRRKREVAMARDVAESALQSELKGTVTALLLSCEMALKVEHLPAAAEAKMRTAYDLARELRGKLGAVG